MVLGGAKMDDFEAYYSNLKNQISGGSGQGGDDDFSKFYEGLKMDIGSIPDTRQKPAPTMEDKVNLGQLPSFDITKSPLMKQASQEDTSGSLGNLLPRFSASTQVAIAPDKPMFKSQDWKGKSLWDLIKSFGDTPEYDTSVPTPKQAAIAQRDQYDAGPVGNKVADVGGEIASFFTPMGAPGMSAQGAASALTGRLAATKLGMKAEGALGNLGAGFANKLNPFLNAGGMNLSSNLTKKIAQTGGLGALDFGMANTSHAMQTTDANPSDLGSAALEGVVGGAALGGAFGAAGVGLEKLASKYAGTKFGDALGNWFGNGTRAVEPDVQPQGQILGLPEPRSVIAQRRSVLEPNLDPIAGQGDIYTFGLPEGKYTTPERFKINKPEDSFQSVYEKVLPAAVERMTPPLENPNELAKWVQGHLNDAGHDVSLNQVRDLNYEGLRQIAEEVRTRLNPASVVQKTARDMGYGKIYEMTTPSIKERIAQDAQKQVYGIGPSKVNIGRPESFNISKTSAAAAPESKLGFVPKPEKANLERGKPVNIVENGPSKGISKIERTIPQEATPETIDDVIQTKDPRIRDKVVNILDDAEKAARARMAARKSRLNSLPVDEWADHAIILAAQMGKGGIKLVDATEFLVKEFGEHIRPHATKILFQARNVVKEAERRASKEAQEARAFNEGQTGDAESFSGKVSRDVSKEKTSFAQKVERIRTQFVDDLAPLESLEKRIRGEVSSAEDSLYKSGRLFRGVPEKANLIVKERLSPIINGIEKQGYTSKELGDYALAVHAKDVNALDIKSGFTNKEIENVIQKYGTPEMEAARKELVKVSDDMLQELANAGVISKELMESLRKKYRNYIPLFRAFDDKAVGFADGLSKALANVTAPIKGLKGSERQVVDPLENMVKNIFESTNAAERNKVAQQLSKLSKDDPEGNFIRKLDEHEDVGRKNVVSVLENGNKVRYEVEPEVYKAMLNLDKESSNMLIKVLQKPASLLRAGATLTPEFSLRNPLRDVVQAFVTSNSGFNPIIDFPVGLMQSISKGNLYKQWVKELGAYGNIISNDRQVHREALERVLKEPAGKKFVNIINGKSLIEVLRAISDTTESATKVGEFRAALRKGVTPEEAAYRSRDIMDFGRAGSAIRETNKVVAFLNANIQGKSKLLRAIKENPAGVSARAFTAITVPTIGAFLMQKYMANESQKLTIDESPQWLKDSFWLLPIPGTDQVARIPKPFDLNVLFSNLPERAMNYVWNNDKEAMDGFAKKSIADSALPGMISGIVPFIEGMANYSFFRQGSIIPQGEDGRNFEDQYDINTTETAKLLAKGANAITSGEGSFKNFSSPRIMDNTIKGLTAGLGSYATSAIDVFLDKFGVTDNPSRPAKGPAQQPLAKAFLVNPTQSGKSTEDLYNLKDRLTRESGSAKLNDNAFTDGQRLKGITKQTDAMSKITKEIRSIENNRDLTPKIKRELIDSRLNERNTIAREAYKKYK
jgi:hypothetical protein